MSRAKDLGQHAVGAIILGALLAGPAAARDISTDEIAALSLSSGCLDYQITGFCLFLICDLFECSIETTARISHFLPDVVVSAYQRTGENPWAEMAGLGAAGAGAVGGLLGADAGLLVEGGHQREGTRIEAHENVRFKETDVIGNPIVSGSDLTLAYGFLCSSEAESFFPYFLSTVDAIGWRSGVTELIYPASFIPGLREIGNWPLNTWGSVHPRQGFVNTSEDPKAAAVCAQRAADIVTRELQPHAYVFLGGGDCGDGCEPPGPVFENDPENSKWQMLTPIAESTCDVFGINDVFQPFSWADFKQVDETEDYAWNLWRRYRCCFPSLGIFLGSIEF
ncbi:MAG: TIGR03756 family integrating conjugative element protein [Gammaproteobacteria bacterium]